MSLQSLCQTHAATVQRQTTSIDPSGGPVAAWSNVSGMANLPCTVQPTSAHEKRLYMQRNLKFDYRVVFPFDPGVKKGDRLLVNSTTSSGEGGLPGQTLVVTNYRDPAGRGQHVTVECYGLE